MLTLEINGASLKPHQTNYHEVEFGNQDSMENVPSGPIALNIENNIKVEELGSELDKYNAIIINFPAFNDGRAYSQARQLRERFNFKGRILARGEVLADQILFMNRCGIDIVEINGNDTSAFENALTEFSNFYQPSADDIKPIWALREEQKRAAA